MKTIIHEIKANLRPAVQMLLIMLTGIVVIQCHVTEYFLPNATFTPQNVIYKVLFDLGDKVIGVFVAIVVFVFFSRQNKEVIFNQQNVYHDYSYAWYLIFGKLLGYKTCNLAGVPIYMQFKLVLNDTFPRYDYGNINGEISEEVIKIKIKNPNENTKEVNLIIADTYPIKGKQLAESKKDLYSIKISRNNKKDNNRYKSPELVKAVVNQLRILPKGVDRVNVFSTTNPYNTYEIVNQAFKLHGRGNINNIVVYQQSNVGERIFIDKGIWVFKSYKKMTKS